MTRMTKAYKSNISKDEDTHLPSFGGDHEDVVVERTEIGNNDPLLEG